MGCERSAVQIRPPRPKFGARGVNPASCGIMPASAGGMPIPAAPTRIDMARSTKQTSQGGPHLDRWHYFDYRDGKHDKYFAEWKYFNFTQPGLAGYIVYYILSPEKKTGISGGRLLIRVFKNNTSFGSIKRIPVDRIQCDNVSADIVMAGAGV